MFGRFDKTGRRGGKNVFESVIDLPEIEIIKNKMLEAGAAEAAMSGSGPTVFGIFYDGSQAKYAEKLLIPAFPKTFITKPV
jgi:4-diphosphocytidyl-2-C-methyl-D-erythritol kinase